MKTEKLTVTECNVTGELGFLPESNRSFFEASEYYIISANIGHDVIDHMPDEQGTLEQELLALGGVLWRMAYTSPKGFMSDLQNTFRDAGRPAISCPQVVENVVIENKVDMVWPDLEQSLEDCPDDFGYFDDDAEIPALDELWNRQNLTAWLSMGYARAASRYADFEPRQITNIILTINDAARKAYRSVCSEGQTFVLNYDIANNWAEVVETEPDYDDEDLD